jgi:hypothetical protein
MIHQFMYPQVTPVKPGSGGRGGMVPGAGKPAAPGPAAAAHRAR